MIADMFVFSNKLLINSAERTYICEVAKIYSSYLTKGDKDVYVLMVFFIHMFCLHLFIYFIYCYRTNL